MKRTLPILFLLVSLLNYSHAFTQNSCGLRAIMSPGNDSILNGPTVVMFTSISTNATSYKFIIDQSVFQLNNPVNYGFQTGITEVKLVAYNGNCTDTAVSYYFFPGTAPPDTNNQKMYYGTHGVNEYVKNFLGLRDGSYLVAGDRNNNSWLNLPQRGLLFKTKAGGCVEWARLLEGTFTSAIDNFEEADNGDLFLTGNKDNSSPFLSRLDASGNIRWTKMFTAGGGQTLYPFGLKSIPDGLLMTAGNGGKLVILRLDNNANIIWQKQYDQSLFDSRAVKNLLVMNNDLYIAGYIFHPALSTSHSSILMKLDLATGQTQWTRRFYSTNNVIFFLRDLHQQNNNVLVSASYPATAGNYPVGGLVRVDANGTLLSNTLITQTDEYYVNKTQLVPLPGKKYYMLSAGTKPLALQPGISYQTKLVKLDSNFNILWSRHHAAIDLGQYFHAAADADETLVIAGNENGQGNAYYSSTSRKIVVKKIDSSGIAPSNSCMIHDWPMNTSSPTIMNDPWTWATDIISNFMPGDLAISLNPYYPELRYKCPDYIDSCSFLAVSGPSSVCNLNRDYTYKIHKNKACGQSIQWQIPPSVNIISQSDTALTVRFSAFGDFSIAALLPIACTPIKDSVRVHVTSGTPPLNLGADTSLCPNNSITLQAGPGFLSYLWQDGTTNSSLMANGPGQYWVSVSDSCGNILRDTIGISATAAIPLSLGPDKTKCNSDTIQLSAPGGFINYTWSPNYNISSTTTQQVIINPQVDTVYTIKAEKTPGCFGLDTLRIKVFTSPPIQLGPDLGFCSGDSAILDAGTGFSSYLWNTGTTNQRLVTQVTGNFSIIGTTLQGCKSFDTLRILSVYPLPVVSLNPDSTLCSGTSRQLTAGNGFVSSLWNNGAITPNITVSTMGTYSVIVTDNNGCKGSGTIKINTILPLPANFLPADTVICSYGTIQLSPIKSFTQYQWSNGSSSFSTTITKPGSYWLEVRDKNNCIGKDTITVGLKDCMSGFFMPTAFTPNNDGKNDVLRPLLFGNIKQYQFTIYNRWGQVVFQSSTPGQGWNGKLGFYTQDGNVYAWTCRYQLIDEPAKLEKGSFVIIR